MIDISDGLLADLGHILRLSGQGARIDIKSIPLSSDYLQLAGRFNADRYTFCLGGGEDYELLFTLPPASVAEAQLIGTDTGTTVTVIGEITADNGLYVAAPDGSRYDITMKGYDHFSTSPQ